MIKPEDSALRYTYSINGKSSVTFTFINGTLPFNNGTLEKKYSDIFPLNTITRENFEDRTKAVVNAALELMKSSNSKLNIYQSGWGADGEWMIFTENSTIHTSIDIYERQLYDAHMLRYAYRLYDGSLVKHSAPLLICGPTNLLDMKATTYVFSGNNPVADSRVKVESYKMQLNWIDLSSLAEWSDIIKSIDFFLSDEIGVTSSENISISIVKDSQIQWQRVIEEIKKSTIKAIKDSSSFYLIHSHNIIPGSNNSILFPSTPDDALILKNLLFKEVMTDDNFTHHKLGAGKSYVYNGRLNIADIKTTLFKGFSYNMFKWNSKYNGEDRVDYISALDAFKFRFEIELRIDGSIKKVFSDTYETFSSPIYALFINPYLSYPDPRATKIRIWTNYKYDGVYHDWTYQELKLTQHDFLNISYFLNETLLPTISVSSTTGTIGAQTPIFISEPNKLKVSSLNNPFNFPSINTYTIGNGRILGLMSNAMRTSDGQFGQYPMMAFTNERIYALNIGTGEVVYSNITPISNTTPTLDTLCQTPFGIVFVSNRGLYAINGQEVNFLSSQIEQEPLPLSFNEMMNGVSTGITTLTNGTIHNFNQASFIEYTKGITNIVFNPLENELIICNSNFEYNYVYNVDSQMYYQSTEVIDVVVGNTYPNLFVTQNGSTSSILKDYYLSEPNSQVNASFITRPITFTGQILDIKRLDRMILRAKMDNATKMSAIVHASDDGIAFKVKRGMSFAPNYYRDILLGLMGKNKHRQFCYAWGGTIDSTTQLTMIETDVIDEYNNDKMK